MRRVPLFALVFMIFVRLITAPSTVVAQEAADFAFSESDQGVLVSDGAAKVLFYQRAEKSFEGKFSRSHYIHPLYDLEGRIVSEDFPADHRHHRGIFWAWHQVWVGDTRAGDPWVCEDFQWDVQSVDPKLCEDGTAELEIRMHWKSPRVVDASGQLTPLVEETAVVRIHPVVGDQRAIDFSYRLVPLVQNLRIGGSEDEKGYGGFCARIALPEDLRFVSSTGEVQAQTLQIQSGPWMDMSGTFGVDSNAKAGESVSGMAILCHPTLPDHVQPWILRDRHSMQNAVWPGRQPVLLSQDQPLAFNYRLLLHRNGAESAKVAERYDDFANEEPRLSSDID